MRRTIISIVLAVLVVAGLASAAIAVGGGHSTVTRARLERSITKSFSHVYTQEARLLGHKGVTPESMHAKAMCDDGAKDSGPGSNWNCLMSWHDPNTPMPSSGYGKFELNVHSNDCFTAGSPSSLVGFQTLTDKRGRVVNNPAYEFDACFDPNGDNSPTGVSFPSMLTVTTTTLEVDSHGKSSIAVTCGPGADGCAGTMDFTAGSRSLGRVPFTMAENAASTISLPQPIPAGVKEVDLAVNTTRGYASSSTTLPVQGR